jgi:hypothetical protein
MSFARRVQRHASPTKAMLRMLKCGKHGPRPWRGTVVCNECERVYTTHDSALPSHAPEVCACEAVLMPMKGPLPLAETFSARVCCAECYRERAHEALGKVLAEAIKKG